MANLQKLQGSDTLRQMWPKINANDEALNAELADVLFRLNNILADAGNSNPEIVDARLGADGAVRPTLGNLVREVHTQLLSVLGIRDEVIDARIGGDGQARDSVGNLIREIESIQKTISYITENKAILVSFQAHAKFRAWQGVATDGNYIYVVTDRNENFELENIISVYSMDGLFISEKRNAYTGVDSTGKFMSFGDCSIIDGQLFVPVYNCNSGGQSPYESRVIRYSLPDLTLVSEHNIGTGVAECIVKYQNDFWVCYHDLQQVRRFNSSFALLNTYPLSQPAELEGGYQSLLWEDGYLYLNMHGSNDYGRLYAPGLDKYSFDGNAFHFVERIKPPTYGAGQGIDKANGLYYWSDRPGNQIIVTNKLKNGLLTPLNRESDVVLLGSVGLGTKPALYSTAGRRYLSIKGETSIGVLELASGAPDADGIPLGSIQFVDVNSISPDKRIGNIAMYLEGNTSNKRGGAIAFATKPDNSDGISVKMSIHGDGIVDIANQSGFRAYQSTAQTLTAATFTKVLFQTKEFDNQSEFDVNLSRFVCKRGGVYQVSCGVGFNQPAGNRTILSLMKNGVEYAVLYDGVSSSATDASFAGGTLVKLAPGDYIELFVNSTNVVNTFALSKRTFFTALKLV